MSFIINSQKEKPVMDVGVTQNHVRNSKVPDSNTCDLES